MKPLLYASSSLVYWVNKVALFSTEYQVDHMYRYLLNIATIRLRLYRLWIRANIVCFLFVNSILK